MKALVVFTNSERSPLRWALKDGFHHCFCVVSVSGLWLEINSQRGMVTLRYLTNADDVFDLGAFYREQGMNVVETTQKTDPVRSPLIARNCVGMVKAVLGVRSWAVTPYQLYKHLLFNDLEGA